MRVGFAGTPEFARVALARLLDAGVPVPIVLSQPDRPAGRGLQLAASPVKQLALARAIALAQPRGLKLDGRFADDARDVQASIAAARLDLLVVAAYGLILPRWLLDLSRLGCLNIHASLLPRWRGAAPIHRAIEAGDAETGITIMQMDEGLDTGVMLLREAVPIRLDDSTGTLHDRLATLGGRLIVEAIELAACGGLAATPQPDAGVTYAAKIDKAEARIRWADAAPVIERRLRAFDPAPGATALLDGELVKLWRGGVVAGAGSGSGVPGEVLHVDAHGIVVVCGSGALRLTELQRAGGRRLAAREFLAGRPIVAGARFE